MKKDKMIKNTCGAISLMLALLVVPFYAVAGILVEASRYQSALTGLDDAMNTSALSVLSDYDSFLQSRFGLLAMAQNDDPSVDNGYTGNKDLEEAFQKYLNAQDTTDTRSFRTTSAAAAGVYPLADTDILKAQVLDYSTLTLPTVLVSEFGSTGLQDIIKEVQNSIPGLKFLKVGSSIADTATKTLDVTKKLEKAKDSVKSLNEKTTSYDSAHSAFDDALNELKKTMGEKPGENATVDELDAYNKRYEQTLENAQKAKKEYEKKLQAEIKSTESLNKDLKDVAKTQDEVLDGWVSVGKDAVNAVGDAKNTKVDTSGEETTVTTLTGQIDATKKELEKKDITAEEKTKLEQQLKQLQQQEADLKTISNAADATVKAADSSQANKILKDYNTDSCSTAISGLTEELNRVKDMNLSDLTLDDADKITKLQEGLHLTDMSKLSDSDNFNSLLKEANDLINKADSNVTSFSSIAEALSTIMSLSASYDPKLQSVINTEYYDQNFAGLPSKKDRSNSAYTLESPYEQKDAALAQADLDAIDFVNEIMDLTAWQGGVSTAASADTSKADDAKTKIGKLLNSMKSMLSMVTAGANILSNLSNIKADIGDHLYLVGYLNYTTTNRTDYASKKTMSGVSIKGSNGLAAEVAKSENNLTAIFDAKEETNYSFCGAETEYLLIGNEHERENQKAIFYTMLALRVALDYKSVTSNVEARALSAGLAGALSLLGIPYKMTDMLAKVFLVAAEAYVDTVLICNGAQDIPFIKASEDIHFCAKGLSKLPGKLQKLVAMTDDQKKTLQEKVKQVEAGGVILGGLESDGKGVEDLPNLKGSNGLYVGDNKLCMTYSRSMFVMMLIWNEKDLVKRFADLIEMEATQKNLVNDASVSQKLSGIYPKFDLDKSYTALRMNVKGDFVSVLPVPSLSRNSVWKANRVMYRGY